jgi:hypothetical protein
MALVMVGRRKPQDETTALFAAGMRSLTIESDFEALDR